MLPNSNGSILAPLRELTEEEELRYTAMTAVATEAINRFQLFKIHTLNYEAWTDFISALLRLERQRADNMLELDRLLMNFLGSARSLIDHFTLYYRRTFRNSPQENHFDELLDRLKADSRAFAFFQDFRNFVQHCGLGIGSISTHKDHHSVTVRAEASADWLLSHYNRWNLCKLASRKGEKLDLIKLAQYYQRDLHGKVGTFLAQSFIPRLTPPHIFFASLAEEVTKNTPNHVPVLYTEDVTPTASEIRRHIIQFLSDLLCEIGFRNVGTVGGST